MNNTKYQEILLKAKIEIGTEAKYTIHSGGGGMALWINVGENRALAKKLRKEAPMKFYGLRTVVVYSNSGAREDKGLTN